MSNSRLVSGDRLSVIGYQWLNRSPATDHRLPITAYRPPTTDYRLPLTLLFLLGIALRIPRLGWQPIWWDEGYSIYFATEPLAHMLSLTARDIHPPLYYALLHAWINLTGSTAPATLRILSVIIGALALPIFVWLAQILFRSPPRTLIATLLLAVSPMHIYYSHELRMYGLAMLLGLAATALLWRLATHPTTPNTVAYALGVSILLYTIYYSGFLILAHAIWVLWHFRRDRSAYKPFITAYAIAALLYLPWIIYSAANLTAYVGAKIGFDNDTPLTPIVYLWKHLLAFTTGHLPTQNAILSALSLAGLLGLVLLLVYTIIARFGGVPSTSALGENDQPRTQLDHAARPAIWICFAIPMVIGFLLNVRLPFFPDAGERLLLFVLPYFLLLVADGIVSLSNSLRSAWKPSIDALGPQSAQSSAPRKSMGQVSNQPLPNLRLLREGTVAEAELGADVNQILDPATISSPSRGGVRPLLEIESSNGRCSQRLLGCPIRDSISWNSLRWGRNTASHVTLPIAIVLLLCFLLAAGVGIFNFYTVARYTEHDYRPIIQQIVQQGRDEDALLAIFPWQVGYWRAYAPPELRSQEPLLLGQTSLEWSDAIRTQIDDRLADGGTLWFPAPLSLGSDLPVAINAHLQRSLMLSNVEMRWINETTRLSAWQQAPQPSTAPATLFDADFDADVGAVKLVAESVYPAELASTNEVLHVEMAWQVADGPETPLRVTLQLVDEQQRTWSRRSVRVVDGWPIRWGLVVPTGLPPGRYTVRASVDRLSVDTSRVNTDRVEQPSAEQSHAEQSSADRNRENSAGEEAVPQFVQSGIAPDGSSQAPSRYVSLGEVTVTQPAEPMATYRLPIEREVVPVATDSALSLLGVGGIDPGKSALAGTRIGLDIFIQNRSANPPSRALYVSLLDADGADVAGGEGWPLAGYPTEGLAEGALLRVPFGVDLPAALPSGEYGLIAGWLDPQSGAKSDAAALGSVRVMQREASLEPPVMTSSLQPPALFGSHAELIGYDTVVEGRLDLTLYWRVEQALLPPHNIFVHLVAAGSDMSNGGALVAQWDGVPQSIGAGDELILAPTGSWQAGEFLATRHTLPLVDEPLDDDELTLRVGLYVPQSGVRLPVAVEGAVIGDFVQLDVR